MAQQRRRPTGGRDAAAGRSTGRDQRGGGPRERGGAPRDQRAPRQQPPPPDLSGARARLREVVEPVVVAVGYDLDALSLNRIGRRHLVRVTVDGEHGVSLDDVALVSREISSALDAAEEAGGELVAGEYELEVSTPWVDRPLTLPRHWRRNVGRLVKVTASDRAVTGRVTAADESGIVLDVDGTPRPVPYAELGPGRVQIEFNRLTGLADEEIGDEFADESDHEFVDGADEIDDEEGGDEE